MVSLILIPVLVMYIQNEARWTLKETRSNVAYHLAEAGADRAIWYVLQSSANWTAASSGIAISGYNGDSQYSDLSGGLYTIRITSGPLSDQITVVSKGRDNSTKELRTIKGVYSGAALASGLGVSGSIDYQPNFSVHWGEVISYNDINLPNASAPYYPARRSKGSVDPWDTSVNPPNSDSSKNYIAFDTTLTTPPEIDFDYYRQKAKNTLAPDPGAVGGGSNGGQSAGYRGTGYFDGASEVKFKSYNFECSTCVFFVESDDAKLEDTAASRGFMHIEALIIQSGNLHIHSNGKNPYTVSVPTDAWKQYTGGTSINPNGPADTAALDEYPGDGGYHLVKVSHTLPNATFDGAGNTGVAFHGFIYTNSFNCSGGNNILVGRLGVGSGGTSINTMNIYYDPAAASGVHYSKSPINRISWDEIVSTWP